LLPEKNKHDLEEIPKRIRGDLKFHFVKEMDELLAIALQPPDEAKAGEPLKTAQAGVVN
jgi:ATP-dependent Lon protease